MSSLREFIDAVAAAYAQHTRDPEGRRSVAEIFAALGEVASEPSKPVRLPCVVHLDAVCDADRFEDAALREVAQCFRALEPELTWTTRAGDWTNANAAFEQGHANAMIVGPGGYVRRSDVWLGVSLVGPQVRYPDHTHPPEETYLAMSDGEFYQEGQGWFTPGIGGTFYNPPGILHAMRTGDAPLFAIWALKRGVA